MKRTINGQPILKKLAIVLAIVLSLPATGSAQTAQSVMADIYNVYDSFPYLSFDVKYIYTTDTVAGNFTNETLTGDYTMAGKKAIYHIGDVEFMQNDSFFIAVYPGDKMILVGDPKTSNTGNELPLRAMMDSMITSYAAHYTINLTFDPTVCTVEFERADSIAQFDKFVVSYDSSNHFLSSIRYNFREPNMNDTLADELPLRLKQLTIAFDNYRTDNTSADIYRENNYIWLEDGEWKGVGKYKGFQVFYSKPARTNYAPAALP